MDGWMGCSVVAATATGTALSVLRELERPGCTTVGPSHIFHIGRMSTASVAKNWHGSLSRHYSLDL